MTGLDLPQNESNRALIFAESAAREKLAQAQPQRRAVVEPPVDRLAARVDVVASTELD
ncbi:MAG TPA: hypothetical protein VN947_35385 [Polyangia bacterium]|nr:hypothetical protein [Polyangia bacterium]